MLDPIGDGEGVGEDSIPTYVGALVDIHDDQEANEDLGRGGISQNVYTSGKVRDSRQIQCYPKCAIRDKFNTKKVKKV